MAAQVEYRKPAPDPRCVSCVHKIEPPFPYLKDGCGKVVVRMYDPPQYPYIVVDSSGKSKCLDYEQTWKAKVLSVFIDRS